MTLEMVLKGLEALGADVEYEVTSEGDVEVTVQDFGGFDEDWSEIIVDYTKAVDEFEELLEAECVSHEGDLYTYYQFDGFTVVWGYASFDI